MISYVYRVVTRDSMANTPRPISLHWLLDKYRPDFTHMATEMSGCILQDTHGPILAQNKRKIAKQTNNNNKKNKVNWFYKSCQEEAETILTLSISLCQGQPAGRQDQMITNFKHHLWEESKPPSQGKDEAGPNGQVNLCWSDCAQAMQMPFWDTWLGGGAFITTPKAKFKGDNGALLTSLSQSLMSLTANIIHTSKQKNPRPW